RGDADTVDAGTADDRDAPAALGAGTRTANVSLRTETRLAQPRLATRAAGRGRSSSCRRRPLPRCSSCDVSGHEALEELLRQLVLADQRVGEKGLLRRDRAPGHRC